MAGSECQQSKAGTPTAAPSAHDESQLRAAFAWRHARGTVWGSLRSDGIITIMAYDTVVRVEDATSVKLARGTHLPTNRKLMMSTAIGGGAATTGNHSRTYNSTV